ncbi:MAG: T9SS type A sorting domain-containing protein, partial [Bacteroidota bacterium]
MRFEVPDFVWTGVVSSAWDDPDNWSQLLVPGASTEVIIPDVNTHDPIIDGGSVSVKSITLQAGASLTVAENGNALVIAEAEGVGIAVDGQLTIGTNSNLTVISSVDQAILIGASGALNNEGTVDIGTGPNGNIGGAGLENDGVFFNGGLLSLDLTGVDAAAIRDFGTFTNAGTISGNGVNIRLATDLGGTLAPGFSPGVFTFEGGQRFASGAVLQIEAEGPNAGETDRIVISGVANLNNLNLEVTVNYGPEDGDRIDLINAAVISGTLASVSLPPGWELLLGPSVAMRFDASILPVELTDFSASAVDKTVVLDWETAAEIDNEGFEVLHAVDGINWNVIGFVAGSGNTEAQSAYTFTHIDPVVGENYYRLRQLDFDGQSADSPIRVVTFEGGSGDPDLEVYPNPSTDLVYVAFPNQSTDQTLRIVNGLGQVMYETTITEAQDQVTIDLRQWPSGTYFVTLGTRTGRVT